MTYITISYRIKSGNKKAWVFDFKIDSKTGELISDPISNPPLWTALEYRQCSHCPLEKTEHPHCPVALQLHNIIEHFHNTSSIDEVELEVITEDRRILQTLPLQSAIGSMLGLVAPTCGCPKMAFMKPMARFHLPLSSDEETLYRVAGMYLLSQHFFGNAKTGITTVDFSGLKTIYDDLHILNKALATRVRGATESDSSKNAIALLDMYSNLVPMMIEDQLPQLRQLFSAYAPTVKKARQKTEEELAFDALMQEVSADELAELLGTQKDVVVKSPVSNSQEKPKGKAVFKLADD